MVFPCYMARMNKTAMDRSLRAGAAIIVLVLGSANAAVGAPAIPPTSFPEQSASVAAAAIRGLLYSNDRGDLVLSPIDLAQLQRLYAERKFEPIWSGSPEAEERAGIARMALARAEDQGLTPSDYAMRRRSGGNSPQQTADGDVEFTRNVLRYARDVRTGRLPPNAIYRDVGLPEADFDPVAALVGALRDGAFQVFFSDLPPPRAEYRHLVTALARYRAIEAQGGWPAVPAIGEIKPGSGDPRLGPLMRRLEAEDPDVPASGDGDFTVAVKRYQTRNGLTPDGRVGQLTLEMLNVSASERVAQISANMERWRWLPRTFEPSPESKR